ncbi:MAG: hypothetical protein UR21_C0004G0021 [Candidatus Woesebacteria bacterium GW2011_GWC2_31_9]|uniref:Glycosyltransferase RgtA/B/C/D-like domain-containing protein n=1 Tax=Candidatus Woesebacteria bacterium GW2011_GWC2_31_9 TaxID=1618586 RepID=A0A0G0AZB0_9BACT|nr:MAG: hypothetical protein UR21_C0004G0021 [Candidatus Woesebacteria bacterium GW2011_GWC2_31_9]
MKILTKIFIGIFIFIIIYFSFNALTTNPNLLNESDSLTYHIPIAESILKGNILNPPNLSHGLGFYPAVGEVILSIFILLGIPLGFFNIVAIIILFFVLKILSDEYGINKYVSNIFSVSVITLNSIIRLIPNQTIDIWLLIFFSLALLFIKKFENEKLKSLLPLGLSLGLIIGVKYSGLVYLLILFLVYFKVIFKKINIKNLIYLFLPILTIGGFWYFRNYLLINNPFYPINILGFTGSSDFQLVETYKPLLTSNGLYLFVEALISEYLIWVLIPIFLFISKSKINKSLIVISVLNFIPFLFFPSDFSRQIITSNMRFLYVSIMPLILLCFISVENTKFEKLLYILSLLSSISILSQFNYYPKLILFWLTIFILIYTNHKK